jgi:transposase
VERCSAAASFPTTIAGYAQALGWFERFGQIDALAVESTGSYAAALVRYLREHDIRVMEVNQPHPHTRRRIGKSDPIDAEMAARMLLAGKATVIPKHTTGVVESIRVLRVARESALKARTAAMLQLGDLIITAPQPLRDRLAQRKTLRGQASICARFRLSVADRRDPHHATKLALRSIAQRIDSLDREIIELDRELEQRVKQAAPRTIQLLGISIGHAGQLLTTAGENIDRLTGESSFAAHCGASPIPASSGKTSRHRLNPGGNRDANRALHLIAVVRLRYCPRTRAYAERRTREGKSKREIIRCLRRYIAREVYNTLLADLTALSPSAPPRSVTSIHCGGFSSGITRRRA